MILKGACPFVDLTFFLGMGGLNLLNLTSRQGPFFAEMLLYCYWIPIRAPFV
jgi:hypothetical protein